MRLRFAVIDVFMGSTVF